MKFVKVLLVLILFLVFGAQVWAVPLWHGYGNKPGTLYEDNDLDFFVDNNNDGKITEGDYLYAVAEFSNAVRLDETGLGMFSVPLDEDNDELVAIIRLKVVEKDSVWKMGPIDPDTPIIEVYTGGTINLDVLTGDPTRSEAENAVTDGTFLWAFSITDDPDTFWTFSPIIPSGADDPAYVRSLGGSTKVGVANFALNQVAGDPIFNYQYNPFYHPDDGLVHLVGSADIVGGAGLTHAFARSDADVDLNPIPEPSTILLVGAGLISLGVLGRKRYRDKK